MKLETNHRFAVYLKIFKLIHNQLQQSQSISKRQIYYSDVKLFQRQETVDNCIDIISNSLGLSIEQLNIHASQKGLIYADLHSNKFTLSKSHGSSLIPSIPSTLSTPNIILSSITPIPNAIIVLEKDAILSALVKGENESSIKTFNNSILLTGRGFPDRLTKQFLNLLSNYLFQQIPVYGYFDADIYGLLISTEYKFKNFNNTNHPPCSKLIIKGAKLFPSKWNQKELNLIPITSKDIQMSISHFNKFNNCINDTSYNDIINPQIREIKRSMFLGVKRELQINDITL